MTAYERRTRVTLTHAEAVVVAYAVADVKENASKTGMLSRELAALERAEEKLAAAIRKANAANRAKAAAR